MSATHWLALGLVSGVGALGSVTGLRPLPVAGNTVQPPVTLDSVRSRSYAATLKGVHAAHRTIIKNISHAQTPGYRAVRPLFEHWPDDTGRTRGVMLPRMESSPRPGWPIDTGRSLDVRIEGTGHLQVVAPDAPGGRAYTRVGHLTVDPQGFLAAGLPGQTARRLEPPVAVPEAATNLRIAADGTVEAMAPETRAWVELGTLRLVAFPRDEGLLPAGDVLHATAESGAPQTADPGTPGLGRLRSGTLEGSKVELAAESEQLRFLRARSKRLSEALQQPDPLATGTASTH